MPHELRDLDVDEISTCGRGKNRPSRILLRKSDDDSSPLGRFMGGIRALAARLAKGEPADDALDTIEQALGAPLEPHDGGEDGDGEDIGKALSFNGATAADEISSMGYRLSESIRGILADEDVENKAAAIADSIDQYRARALACVSGAGAPAGSISKSEEDDMPTPAEQKPAENAGGTIDMNALATMIAKAAGDAATAAATAATADLAKQVGELATLAKAASDRADAAAATLAETREAEATRLAKAQAEEALGALPGDRNALATILKGLPEDQRGTLVSVLKSAGELAAAGDVFTSRGVAATAPGSPEAQFEAAAAEIRKANPELSEAQAYERAVEQNRGAYTRMAKAAHERAQGMPVA